jgi:hypothetical protein
LREIEPKLTPELLRHVGRVDVAKAPPYEILNYRQLVEHVARLAYLNRDHLLFYRGQDKDYQSKAGGTTLYPAIYRGDYVPQREVALRFEQLDRASKILVELFTAASIEGYRDVARKRYMQWSILQHYEVLATPLLDLTHSLRVACSFAQLASTDPKCYVYVIGLPYFTNRISIDSEEDIVNVRLLSICPPEALRPYFQEGYLAGTPDITSEFETKTELDFRNRLIAKFTIPRAKRFWGDGFEMTPKTALFPVNDRIEGVCNEVKGRLQQIVLDLGPGDLGQFIRDWAAFEGALLDWARRVTERNVSVREAVRALSRHAGVTEDIVSALESVRQFRNIAVHEPETVRIPQITTAIEKLNAVSKRMPWTTT